MAVAVGQRCVVRIKITDVELRKARDIKATIVSPQGEEKCQNVSFDEVSGVVYVSVDVNSVGSWSMWLGVRFDKELFYTPAFVFAEVDGDAKPCDAPYIVDVEVAGESVSVTPPKVDVDAVTREEFEQLSKDVAGKVDKVEGKGLSTNDYTNVEKAKVAEIEGLKQSIASKADKNGNYPNMTVGKAQGVVGISQVQEALTLTTKPNGNIVIGNLAGQSKEFMPATPSGDPMHYAYEAAGAVWNATTGYWEMYDMTDITNEQMRKSYLRGVFNRSEVAPFAMADIAKVLNAIRFNLPRVGAYNSGATTGHQFAQNNTVMEVCNLSTRTGVFKTYFYTSYNFSTLQVAFQGCSALRMIAGIIDATSATSTTNAFQGCASLKEFRLSQLKISISFADSPLLSKESLLFMIDKCASNATFTIMLHPDVYAKCQEGGEWYSEVNAALSTAQSGKNTTITLASA